MVRIPEEDLENFRKNSKKILKETKREEESGIEWYGYKNPLIQAFNYLIVLICKIIPPSKLKNSLYRFIGIKIGKNVTIADNCFVDPLFPELIKIDDNVIIGWGVKLFTHEFTQESARIGSVHIKKNSLVGMGSIVRPGITVGENSTVASMSFVNKDVKGNVVVGGVPIQSIREKKSRDKEAVEGKSQFFKSRNDSPGRDSNS